MIAGKGSASWADGLDSRARLRLERFAEEYDQIQATEFHMFAGPDEPGVELRDAMDRALVELKVESRRDAAQAAVKKFVDSARHRYSERFGVAELFGLQMGAPTTASDRVHVFESLERAVAAIILWDHLDDQTRTLLAGPWSDLVETAVGVA